MAQQDEAHFEIIDENKARALKKEKLQNEVKDLKNEINRLQESYDNLKIIDEGHQKLNGDLQTKINKLEIENKILEVKLEKQLKEFRNKGVL